jgi:Peptidase family M28
VVAAVNLEARGTSGPSFMFETGSANNWLMRLYAGIMPRPMTNSVYYLAYKLMPNDTDFTVYKTVDYQGFNFAFLGDVEHYHTPLDRWQNTDLASLQQQGANALTMVRGLGRSDLTNPPRAQAVFFDWYRLGLVHWRAALTGFAAMAAALLLALLCVHLGRRGELQSDELWRGGLGLLGAWGVVLAIAALDLWLLLSVGAVPTGKYPWIAHPLPMLISASLLGLLAPALAARWLAMRSGFWGLWAAVQGLNALFCLAFALTAPEVSFLFLVPLLVALASAIPAALVERSTPWMRAIAVLLPLLAATSITLPLTRFVYSALGARGWFVTSAVIGFSLWGLAPLMARATARTRRIFIAVPLACLAICTITTWALPVYSITWPQRLNLDYLLDADTAHGQWLALPASGRLPEQVRAAAPFAATVQAPYRDSAERGFLAPAPLLALDAPQLDVQSATLINGRVHYSVHVSSPRQAPEIYLVFAASDHVDYAELDSERGPLRVRLWAWPKGVRVLDLKTVDENGADVSFTLPAQPKPALQLLDMSFAMPEQAAPLLAARTAEATASQNGDVTMVTRLIHLILPTAP